MIDLKRILVPTDFSKFSQNALTYAVACAENVGAQLTLLHVVQDLALFLPDVVTAGPPLVPPIDQLSSAVHDALKRVVAENHLERFKVQCEVREGTPFYEIIRCA